MIMSKACVLAIQDILDTRPIDECVCLGAGGEELSRVKLDPPIRAIAETTDAGSVRIAFSLKVFVPKETVSIGFFRKAFFRKGR